MVVDLEVGYFLGITREIQVAAIPLKWSRTFGKLIPRYFHPKKKTDYLQQELLGSLCLIKFKTSHVWRKQHTQKKLEQSTPIIELMLITKFRIKVKVQK